MRIASGVILGGQSRNNQHESLYLLIAFPSPQVLPLTSYVLCGTPALAQPRCPTRSPCAVSAGHAVGARHAGHAVGAGSAQRGRAIVCKVTIAGAGCGNICLCGGVCQGTQAAAGFPAQPSASWPLKLPICSTHLPHCLSAVEFNITEMIPEEQEVARQLFDRCALHSACWLSKLQLQQPIGCCPGSTGCCHGGLAVSSAQCLHVCPCASLVCHWITRVQVLRC